MKTIVIESDKDGNAKISVSELKELLAEAYNAGYKDGQRDYTTIWYQPITYPSNGLANTPWWEQVKYEVTCNNSNDDLSFSSMAKQRGD